MGPHLGLMWGRRELLEALPAYKVRPAKDAAPHRWENGTPSYETWNGLPGLPGILGISGRNLWRCGICRSIKARGSK